MKPARLLAIAALALLLVTGCTQAPPQPEEEGPPLEQPAAEPTTTGTPTTGDDTQVEPADALVAVPDVIGMYPEDAEAELVGVGLAIKAIDIHGPLDEDAGNAEIGQIYRQTPAAGEMVPEGTVIEVRSWWEAS